jgi:benzylsuccinate CoA-transferase BbsE subunit
MGLERPYDGLRVIDLTGDLSAYSARLFANLGAEAIMVEPPGGRPERRRDPLPGGEGYGGAGFAFLNAGKKSVVVDWRASDGAETLQRLVASADVVVIESDAKVVSYFGFDGPYADFVGCDLVAQSLGGIAWLSGEPGEAPLRLPGEQSAFVTSVYAAAATALAVWDLERRILTRGGEGIRDATEDPFACKDGHVFLAAPLSLPMCWKAVLEWMSEERDPGYARFSEPDWQNRPLRATAPMKREFRSIFERFVASKTRAEIRDEALRRKIVMAPVSKIGDLVDDPQLVFRQYFAEVAHPALGRSLRMPGAPYRMSEPVWRIDRPAPRVGEDDADIAAAG